MREEVYVVRYKKTHGASKYVEEGESKHVEEGESKYVEEGESKYVRKIRKSENSKKEKNKVS
jgi:hypothetical protein